MPMTETIAARLGAARAHARLTEDEAAGLAQITVRKLQALERGAGPAPVPATLTRLAAAYGVSAVWLRAGASAGAHLVPEWHIGGAR